MLFITHLTITDDGWFRRNDTLLYLQCTSECALGSYLCPVGSTSDTCVNCTTNPGICLSYVSTRAHTCLCPERVLFIMYLDMDAPSLMIVLSTHILLNSHGWIQPSVSFHPTALLESPAGQNSRDSKRVATWPSLRVDWAAPECPISTWRGCVLGATSRGLRGTYKTCLTVSWIRFPCVWVSACSRMWTVMWDMSTWVVYGLYCMQVEIA